MEEQTQTEPEPRILSSDFVDLIKKIAEYVKNEIKTDIITSIGEISTSSLNKDVPLSSEQDISPEKAVIIFKYFHIYKTKILLLFLRALWNKQQLFPHTA